MQIDWREQIFWKTANNNCFRQNLTAKKQWTPFVPDCRIWRVASHTKHKFMFSESWSFDSNLTWFLDTRVLIAIGEAYLLILEHFAIGDYSWSALLSFVLFRAALVSYVTPGGCAGMSSSKAIWYCISNKKIVILGFFLHWPSCQFFPTFVVCFFVFHIRCSAVVFYCTVSRGMVC